MKMNLSEMLASDLHRRICLKATLVAGDGPVETVDDLLTIAECMSDVAKQLKDMAEAVEGKVEDAHLRRGSDILGRSLSKGQIDYNRTIANRPWVATVSCECPVGEFCDKCGVNTASEIDACITEFLNN